MSCLKVSELNELARDALSRTFGGEVWVVGEIHGFRMHSKSGHMYFDLVERPRAKSDVYLAKVSCAFFRGAYEKWKKHLSYRGINGLEFSDGMEVKLRARAELYSREGRFQLIVSFVDPEYVIGAIARKRAALIEELRKKGLIDRNHSREIAFPSLDIGLITSRGSAAYNDFTSIMAVSGYSFRIRCHDSHMQGTDTVADVVRGIEVLGKAEDVDAIAIVRGGGARTDLFSFDNIDICTAIAMCPKPVLTGIGHEIDLSVADIVAARHFVTPTDVARFFVGMADDAWERLDNAQSLIRSVWTLESSTAHERLVRVASILAHGAESVVSKETVTLRSLAFGLYNLVMKEVVKANSQLDALCRDIRADSLAASRKQGFRLDALQRDLTHFARTVTRTAIEKLASMESVVGAMDPVETLKRGFSMSLDPQGRIVLDPDQLSPGEVLTTIVRDGKILSRVEDKEKK